MIENNTNNGAKASESRGNGVNFTRIRRVTGYLAEKDSFNNGKRAELKDRIKHFSVKNFNNDD